jgi:S1-C subfamily serine protease
MVWFEHPVRSLRSVVEAIRLGFSRGHRPGLHAIGIRLVALLAAIGLLTAWSAGGTAGSALAEPEVVAARPPIGTQISAQIGAQSFVADAAQRVGPAVVRIDTERTVTRGIDPRLDDPILRRFFEDELGGRIQPREERQRGQGSGFIIDRAGILLTNAHVVDKADRVRVTLTDGREFDGVVKGVDRVTDMAVVAIKPRGEALPVAELGNSSSVRVGDWAIAIGNPLGLDNTVTLGIVSTLRRPSSEIGINDKRLDFIQTDAAINPGNSGGPLVNGSGQVIGINTAIRADANGIGFAIPIDKAKSIQAQLLKTGKVSHPYLGIQMVTWTPELAEENNRDPNADRILPAINGVLITGVIPNSPAAMAGIRRGDIITQIESDVVKSANQLQKFVDRSTVGQPLQLKIRRGQQTQSLSVRTAELQEMAK